MGKRRVSWHGSFPALMTPFTEAGAIDEPMLRANVRLALDEGVHGFVVCGHNGEAHVMSPDERKRVTAIAIEENAGRVPAICGSGHIATDEVIRLTRDAKDAGTDGAMIETPYFLTPRPADVYKHYAEIADAVDLPIMLYNNPKRTGVDMDLELVDKLADIDGVVAIKDSSFLYDRILELIYGVGDRIQIFVGPARVFGFQGIQMGAHGFVDELQQIMGRPGAQLYDLAVANDHKLGLPIQHMAYRLHTLLARAPGSYPATVKDAMRILGRPGGYSRRPLRAMEGEDLRRFERGLRAIGLAPDMAAE